MKKLLIVSMVLLLPFVLFAQRGTIVGKVTDANNGDELVGANIVIKGTSLGAATGVNGAYKIIKVPAGSYTLRASFMGYKMVEKDVQVTSGQVVTADFALEENIIYGEAIGIIADRAKERETPVAFTNIKKEDMVQRLGSQDIPLVLNTTPSVYSTMQGGGAGDARINVRGFNQRNIAIMINGVPVNDMENGWVYWSNWDGVADATSSIQVQRGLSAVNLATPSIGGTINILTDPTAMDAGARLRQEIGNDGFLKTTFSASSGLINDKFAFNGLIVRKVGDGAIDKTWTDAWAYYFGATWNINANNRLELYALGAPQLHGQNLFKQNIAAYDSNYAKSLDDFDRAAIAAFKQSKAGRFYNENWGPVSASYKGKQNWNEANHDRYDPNFIMERENFFHKPQVNLNWFTKLTDDLSIYTIAYYSGGHGGGTGTFGSMKWNYSGPSRFIDFDATIANNLASTTGSKGILRNSRNNQWTLGAISKINYKVSDDIKVTVGGDWRTAEIEHYYEVRDLLGGEYFINKDNQFDTEAEWKKGLGDKLYYFNTNTVDWFGFFGQSEYKSARISAYGMAGYSMIKYSYTDHFTKMSDGSELFTEADWISGMQIKGGASYKVTSGIDVYANAGYVSKVPIFDNVINDYDGSKADDPKNEKFISLEGGVNFFGLLDNTLTTKLSIYHTTWKDRAWTIGVQKADGSDALVFLSGMNALHQGIELEAAYQPMRLFRFDFATGIGNWKQTDDVSGLYKDYSAPAGQESQEYHLYVKNLKVGDSPQTQFALAATVYPIPDLYAQLVVRHYRDNYANYDLFSRVDPNDRAQSWQAPNYTVVDLHAAYNLPFELAGIKFQLFGHVFNLLDEIYVQDALDNSPYNAYRIDHDNNPATAKVIANPHKADAAEVFLGLPRTFNLGLSLRY